MAIRLSKNYCVIVVLALRAVIDVLAFVTVIDVLAFVN
jgi:hypothetical protein